MDIEAIHQLLKMAFIYAFFSGSKPDLTFSLWESWVKYNTLIEGWSQTHLQHYYKALKQIIKGPTGKDRN